MIPLLKEGLIDISTIIIDAKSGVSGAGRKPKKILKPADISSKIAEGRSVETLTNLAPVQERKGILFKEGLKELPGLVQALKEEGVGRK